VGNVQVLEAHRFAAGLLPGPQPVGHGGDRRQRFHRQIDVDLAPAEVVHDQHVVALIGQVHGTGPAAEAVATQNEDLHRCKPRPSP